MEVTGQTVMDYIAAKVYVNKISQSYSATIQKYLGAFFGWAYRKHHIDVDVNRDIDRIKPTQNRLKRLSDYEVAKCRSAKLSDRQSALLELMLSAGPRVSEICNLTIDNLNFDKGEIYIYGEKSKKWRTCFMTESFKVSMRKYLNGREIGHVFIKKNGTSICAGTIEKDAKVIAKMGECKDPVTVHTYRKTFASREYVRTRDILYVSKRLGHSSTAVTIKYYICDDVESDRRIAYGAS